MSATWNGPYIEVAKIDNLGTIKEVTDNGRTVSRIYALRAQGAYGSNDFPGGSATVPLEQRDNYPLVEMGDVISAFSLRFGSTYSGITRFIVTDVFIDEKDDGTGEVTYSGPGLIKELIRKVLRLPYISEQYAGTTVAYTGTYIFLDAAHAAAEDYYNGGVIFIDGKFCDIDHYSSAENRAYVKNWIPESLGDGTDPLTYILYHGKSDTNLQQAISYSQTGWINTINGIAANGTPGGSFHAVGGRSCLELLRDISKETGYLFRQRDIWQSVRKLDWFNPNDPAIDSFLYLAARSEFTLDELRSLPNKAAIISCDRTTSSRDKWTRVIASTSEGITLQGLTFSDITLPTGFTVIFDESMVVHTAAEAGYHSSQIFERAQTYDNILAHSDTPEAIKAAQISLFYSAVTTLREKDSQNQTYHLRTVLIRDLIVGEKVYVKYVKSIAGEIQFSIDQYLWVRRIDLSADSADGARYFDLELGDNFYSDAADGNAATAQAIKDISSATRGNVVFAAPGTSGGGITDHGQLTGLGDVVDHPDYLLVDGSRQLTGNLAVSNLTTIDTVDLSEFKVSYDGHIVDYNLHKADSAAHHNPVTVGDGLGLTTQQVWIDLATNSGLLFSSADLSMGNPLTIEVGAVQAVTGSTHSHQVISTDNALVNKNQLMHTSSSGHIVFVGVGINVVPSGSGLWLNDDLNFVGVRSIASNNALTIEPTGHLYLRPTTNVVFIDNELRFDAAGWITTLAGDLTIAPYSGNSTLFTRNTVFGTATATENAAVKIKPLVGGDVGLYVQQHDSQSTEMIRFEDKDGNALVLLTLDGDLESGNPGFTSGLTGWQIDHLGNAEFNDLWARGEFHASIFVVDEMHATGGTMAVMTAAQVAPAVNSGDNKLPAIIDSTFVLNIKASVGSGLSLFAVDDIIRLKFAAFGTTSMDVWDVGVEVESIAAVAGRDLTNNEVGYFATTCTWRAGGQAALVIPSSTVGAKWGEVDPVGLPDKSGTYVGGIIMTSDLNDAPYIDVFTLPADHTWGAMPVPTPRVRMGLLDGVMGLGEEWGIAMATDLSDTNYEASSVVISDQGVRLRNVDFKVLDSTNNPRAIITSAGVVKFGTDTDVAGTTSFYFDSNTGDLILGDSGGANAWWDADGVFALRHGTTEVIKLNATGDSYFEGAMELGTNGGIWQASSGTFSAPVSGFKIYNIGGAGRFNFYNSAGLNGMRLDSDGIGFFTPTTGITGKYIGNLDWFSGSLGDIHTASIGTSNPANTNKLNLRAYKSGSPTVVVAEIELLGTTTTGVITLDASYTKSSGDLRAAGGIRAGGVTDVATGEVRASAGIYGSHLQSSGDVRASGGIRAGGVTDVTTGEVRASAGIYGSHLQSSGDVRASGGIRAGGTADVPTGVILASSYISAASYILGNRLIASQGGIDTVALELRSTDVTGMLTQGMSTVNNYFQVQKASSIYGGALLKAGGETDQGMWIAGSIAAPSGYAAVIMQGQKNNGFMADGDNVFGVLNNSTGLFYIKGDGDIYVKNLTHYTFDHLDSDVEMVRTMTLHENPSIRTRFDDLIQYNAVDLEREKLINIVDDGYEMNLTGMLKLLMGAAWENELGNRDRDLAFESLRQRIAALEKLPSLGELAKMFFAKVLQKVS